MNILLYGFPASGKTTLGKKMSEELQRPFIDTDDLITQKCGLSPKELGLEAFRKLEKEIIYSLKPGNAIIALGGGAVLDPDNLAYLKTIGKLVYVRASFETIRERMEQRGLPSFADSIETLYQIYLKRLPIYESIDV